MIEIKKVMKDYAIKDGKINILNDINLKIEPGLNYIVGKSGSGKSTLMNIIGGIDSPSSGNVYYDGNQMDNKSEQDWAEFRKRKVGFVFQNFNLLEHLSALENVEMSLQLSGVGKRERRKRAIELLNRVNMGNHLKKKPAKLSGGQKQRVAIARALANDPQYILADEPTGALDSENALEVMSILKKLSQENRAIVVITHSDKFIELADTIVTMKDGVISKVIQKNESEKKKTANLDIEEKKSLTLMSMINIAMDNLKKTKIRTFFTSFGSSVGLFGILLISFLVTGLNYRMNTSISARSTNDVMIVAKTDGALATKKEQSKVEESQFVKAVYDSNKFNIQLETEDNTIQDMAMNLPPDNQNLSSEYIQEGSLPEATGEVVVSEKIAKKLFISSKNAIGKTVAAKLQLFTGDTAIIYPVQETQLKIVGVFNNESDHKAPIELSYDTEQQIMNNDKMTENKSYFLAVVPTSNKDMVSLNDNLEKLGFSTEDSTAVNVKKYLSIANMVIAALSGISLIVSIILICVVMYISVAERNKEIGILKAIGATPRNIEHMFLFEGGLIGLIGGLVGTAAAVGISLLLNVSIRSLFSTIKFDFFRINLLETVLLVALSVVLGIAGSYFPAKFASKKKPIDVLRYE